MRLAEKHTVQGSRPLDGCMVYTVELDDGSFVQAERLYVPETLSSMQTFRLSKDWLEAHPETDAGEIRKKVYDFLRSAAKDDFSTYEFEYKFWNSYAAVNNGACFSLEQATYIAEIKWKDVKDKRSLTFFRIVVWKDGKRVIVRDWLRPAA